MTGEATVLYVDDDAAMSRVVARALGRHDDLRVETVGAAAEGVERLAIGGVDCVVSDYEMPDTDGIEFLEAIRAAGEDVPFVLYTARGSEAVAGRAIAAGVTDYLRKGEGPDHFRVLARRVHNAIETARSRRALEESEERFRAMVEGSRDAILLYRESVLYANDRACDLAGRDREALVGSEPWCFVHPDDRRRFERRVAARIAGEYLDPEFEFRVLTADGTVRELEATDRSIPVDGEPAGLVAARDVTTARRRQRELETQNRRLEEFAGVLSHDLRGPLNVVAGSLALARETGRDADFDRAAVGLDRMETLIADMLELSRHGSAVEETEPVELAAAADSVWAELGASGGTLGVEDGTVDAAPDRLHQLLANLLSNAVDHGGEAVRVTVGPLQSGGFYVEDDGHGVPPDERERVFRRGYTTADDGVGWGLVVVEHIATAHGWSVSLTEGADGGARFEFRPQLTGRTTPDGVRQA
jgi:PAS domain S-box-containing protein